MNKIINRVRLEAYASLKVIDTPAGKPLLCKDKSILGCESVYNYRSMVGMLIYLRVSAQSLISMAVHQCTHFCNNPYLVHECVVRGITKYLASKLQMWICHTDIDG